MDKKLESIIATYLKEKESFDKEAQDDRTPSNYTVPYRQLLQDAPYYQDQEVTEVHLQLNSPTNNPDGYKPQLDKMLVYPEQEWSNADWAGGDFLSPYVNEIQQEINRTDNDPKNLFDPKMGSFIGDLTSRTASAVDAFLSDNNFVKVSNMDLEQFLKVSDDTLIHKSNNDIWKMVQDKEGNVYISRLVDGDLLEEK